MKQTITGLSTPTAMICINKSRLKVYNHENFPTFYLEKGQEFQIELYNPTSDVILAKIQLNGKQISQGGLVLKPAERIFLERYIDVANKFKFDTYEVANTAEARKAIEDNGDFKVEFYKESNPINLYVAPTIRTYIPQPYYTQHLCGGYNPTAGGGTLTVGNSSGIAFGDNLSGSYTTTTTGNATYTNTANTHIGVATTDSLSYFNSSAPTYSDSMLRSRSRASETPLKKAKLSKTIETGRVDMGSSSNQKLQTVNKSFEYFPFHSLEYKLLPVSQKINSTDDIKIKRYCTHCGKKSVKSDKFCSQCGNKL